MAVIERAPQRFVFARPKLGGGHRHRADVALRSLPEFSQFGWMVKSLAKDVYLSNNPQRKRLPRHFVDKCDLGFELGDNNEPLIIRTVNGDELQLFRGEEAQYDVFTKSRDLLISVLSNHSKQTNTPKGFPIGSLRLFKTLGKTLEKGEYIEFLNENRTTQGIFDTTIKKEILDKIIEKYTRNITTEGIIYALDRHNNTFGIQTSAGELFHSKYSLKWEDRLLQAFNNLAELQVRIDAVGKFNRFDNLISYVDINEIEILNTSKTIPSINDQINEIGKLDNGWMNGEGISFSSDNLQFSKRLIERLTAFHEIQFPYIYPALDGGIQAEWSQNPWETSLKFNFTNQSIELHSINLETETEKNMAIQFTDNEIEHRISDFIKIIELHAGAAK